MTDINVLKVYDNSIADLTRHRPDLTPAEIKAMALQETADFFNVPLDEIRVELERE